MSSNDFTEVTSQGWLSRLGGALKGLIFGLILFILSFPLLIWNEGRTVDRVKTLAEGSGLVIHIPADTVSDVNNKKLVHLSARTLTDETLSDRDFGIKANAIKLKRSVQVFQWNENISTRKVKELGGGEKTIKEYSYTKSWNEHAINSNNFKDSTYKNPSQILYKNRTYTANDIRFGEFVFPGSLTNKMNSFKAINLDLKELPEIENISNYSGGYYVGRDSQSPQVGDIKINFEVVEPAIVSVVAQQTGNTFQPYITSAGGQILLLEYGTVGHENMFQAALDDNRTLTWGVRIAGLILMIIGLVLFLKPLSVLADVVTIFGNIVEAGTGIIALLLAIVLTSITIAMAWLFFRPLIGGSLLLVSVGVLWLIKSRLSNSKNNQLLSEVEVA